MSEKLNVNNQVRQTLMNELGLTREYVRGQIEDILMNEVGKILKGPRLEELLKLAVKSYLEDKLRFNMRDWTESAVKDVLKKRLTISLKA